MTTDGDFRFFFNGESKTRKEIEQLIDYNTTVSIEGLDIFYSSPKVATFKVDTSSKDRDAIRTIQKFLREAEEHQKQNGGILKGAEFPFDLYNKSEDEEFEDYIREQNIISDWERKEENISPFTFNFDDIRLPKEEGVKTNKNKPQLSILFTQFPKALEAIARCSEYGHLKYRDTDFDYLNYQRVEGGSKTYADAGLRHRLHKKSTADTESQLPHAYHVAWNALAELELLIKENLVISK